MREFEDGLKSKVVPFEVFYHYEKFGKFWTLESYVLYFQS
jgi:hypothetical protein